MLGNHQLGVGLSVAYWRVDQQTWARGSGQWDFTGQATGLAMADFLLGRVSVLDHSGLTGITFNQKYLGAYVQDTWTMRRLSLSPGLRLDYFASSIPAMSVEAGRFVPARSFPEITVPSWTNVSPRAAR